MALTLVNQSSSNSQSLFELQLAQRLIKVGIALSAERDLDRLLQLIVTEVRSLCAAEGASLYLRHGDLLCFKISQNDALQTAAQAAKEHFLESFCLPLNQKSHESIAGYVVTTGKTLNLADVHHLPIDAPYRYNDSLDRTTGYCTNSMLTVPLRNFTGEVMGALQLINYQGTSPEVLGNDGIGFPEIAMHVAESLGSQAAVAYNNILLEEQLREAYRDTIYRLSAAAEYRDPETANHLTRMSHYAKIIAKYLGLSPAAQQLIFDASPMHDVGKLGIPDAILFKPGKFTAEERAIMMQHPQIGAQILSNSESELLKISAVIALSHHEKYDGSGYPYGLKGEDIPIEGRIIALADVFDALASKRVYKEAWAIGDILQLIQDDTGKHFDPVIVAAFFAGLDEVMVIHDRYREKSN
jgi:HD-GYP domain-containing protein (c-di-GMP phosphodiesterase class II)